MMEQELHSDLVRALGSFDYDMQREILMVLYNSGQLPKGQLENRIQAFSDKVFWGKLNSLKHQKLIEIVRDDKEFIIGIKLTKFGMKLIDGMTNAQEFLP